MRKNNSIYIIIAVFLLSSFYLIGQTMTSTEELLNNSNEAVDPSNFKSPQLSATEDWYRKYGLSTYNETINEMDTYNKTGDVYLIGYNGTGNEYGVCDVLLIKYNSSGVQEWNRTFNGGFGGSNSGKDIVVDQKTGEIYIVATIDNGSYSENDIFVAKYNETGKQICNITWGYKNIDDTGIGITLNNTDLFVTGQTIGNFVLVKFKSNPLSLSYKWNVSWYSEDSIYNEGKDIVCGKHGNIYIIGDSYKTSGFSDMILICFNASGIQKWNVSFHIVDVRIYGDCVAVDSNDNIYVTGFTMNIYSQGYMFLRKYTNQSVPLWYDTWTGPLGNAIGQDIFIDPNDNILVAVFCGDISIYSKLRIFEYTPSGILTKKMEWRSSDLGVNEFLETYCVSVYNNSNIYVSGVIMNFPPPYDKVNRDIIILKNPTITFVAGGGGVPGNDDDNDDSDGNPPGIPSYDIFIVFGIICLCSALLIKRILNKF